MKGGTIFDNIIITDDKAEADTFAEKWRKLSVENAKTKEEDDKKKEEAAAKLASSADDNDDDDNVSKQMSPSFTFSKRTH